MNTGNSGGAGGVATTPIAPAATAVVVTGDTVAPGADGAKMHNYVLV